MSLILLGACLKLQLDKIKAMNCPSCTCMQIKFIDIEHMPWEIVASL